MAAGLGIVLGIGLYVGPIGMVCPEFTESRYFTCLL